LLLDFPVGATKALVSFVPGSNAEVLQRLQSCTSDDGFVCLWLYGIPGTGKTHLLQGACRLATGLDVAAAYLPGSLAESDPDAGLQALRGLGAYGLIALDDLDCWLGLPGAEEVIFEVYQSLYDRQAALIIASSSSPNDAPFVLADLASRLRAASCYRLHELDDRGKEQLLVSVARDRGFELPGEVTRFLLRRGDRDVAALLNNFAQIEHAALADRRRLTVPLVKRVLGL
jgi:DnaA family protein